MSSSSPSDATGPIKTTGLHVGEPAPGVAKTDPIIVADHILPKEQKSNPINNFLLVTLKPTTS